MMHGENGLLTETGRNLSFCNEYVNLSQVCDRCGHQFAVGIYRLPPRKEETDLGEKLTVLSNSIKVVNRNAIQLGIDVIPKEGKK